RSCGATRCCAPTLTRCTSRTSSRPLDQRCSRNRFWTTTTSATARSAGAARPSQRSRVGDSGGSVRPDVDSTQLMPHPVWENPRVHLLADIWLLTIVAILIATGVPWWAGGFQVDVGTAGWGLLALGGIHIAFTVLASPTRPHGRWRDRAM